MTIEKGLIGKEDINAGTGTFERKGQTGFNITLNQLASTDLEPRSYATASLPSPGVPGREARATDGARGNYRDYGTFWGSRTGEVDVRDFVTGGNGKAASPFTGWEAAVNSAEVGSIIRFHGSGTINAAGVETGVYEASAVLRPPSDCLLVGSGKNVNTSPRIVANHTGVAAVSLKGKSYVSMQNLLISSNATNFPKAGVVCGRDGTLASAGGHYFANLGVRGKFSEAAVYSIASEEVTWIGCDIHLMAGSTGKYAVYTSQDDDLSVDSLGGSTNSRLTFIGFLIASDADLADAATIYIQGGAATINLVFKSGWLGAYRGRYVQINSSGSGPSPIGNLEGPVEFDMINGESGNDTGTKPVIGFEFTVPASGGTTTMKNVRVTQVNLEQYNGSPVFDFIKSTTTEDLTMEFGEFESIQANMPMSFDGVKGSRISSTDSDITIAAASTSNIIRYDAGKTLTVSGTSAGDILLDIKTGLERLNPPLVRLGASGATARGDASYIQHSLTSQFFNLLSPTATSGGFFIGDNSDASSGQLTYDNSTHTWTLGTGGQTALFIVGLNSPEGAITATVGSVFLRTNGGAGTTLYIKESGTGNTGWAAK